MSWLFLVLFCLSFFGSSASAASASFKDSGAVKDSASPIVLYSAAAVSGPRIIFVKFYDGQGWQHQLSIGSDGVFTVPDGVQSTDMFFGISPNIDIDHGFYSASVSLKVPFSSDEVTTKYSLLEAKLQSSPSDTDNFDGVTTVSFNRIVSEFAFDVPMDGISIYSFRIVFDAGQGDLSGEWKIEDFLLPETAEETTGLLESIIAFIQNIFQAIVDLPAKIGAVFQAVGQFIIDGIKGLFLPSDGFFDKYWKQLNDFFSDRFGLLYFPIELTVDMIDRILKISQTDPYIQIPELAWDGHVFIPAQRYEFDFLDNPQFKQIHDYYLMAMDVAMIGALVALLWRKFEEVLKT